MNQNLKIKKKTSREPMLHRSWYEDRGLCLGGAGASLAVALSVFQTLSSTTIENQDMLAVYKGAMTFAMCAMILWIALWQMGDTHAFWMKRNQEKAENYKRERFGIPVFAIAIGSLFASVAMLIFNVAPKGGLVFAVVAAIATYLVLRQSADMKNFMKE